MAPNRYMIAMPAMIIIVGVADLILLIMTIMEVGMSAKTNALATIPAPPMETPRIMASVAPRVAPAETPVVNGSARGFFRVLCMQAPATARPAPAMIPAAILGMRRSNMTSSLVISWMFPVMWSQMI